MDHMEIRCRTVHDFRLDLSNSGHTAVVGSCKCGNEFTCCENVR
jgi:hypothetical protein